MSGYAHAWRSVITEGDTQPYLIEYRHQLADPSTATDGDLVAWSIRTRAEVMRTPVTVSALAVETDGSYRGTISAPVSYLAPGVYAMQAVLTMPDASLWRLPSLGHNLFVAVGPGDAEVPDAPATSSLAVTLEVVGNDFAVWDPIRYDTAAGEWVRSSVTDPYSTEMVVTGVDGDTVTAQGSGSVTVTGGHGLTLGRKWLGSGIPAITGTLPTSGKVEPLLSVVTAEVVLINIAQAGGF